MPRFIDLTSRQFGRLIVIRRDRIEDTKRVWWLCSCDCGQQLTTRSDNLTSGRTQSCGCYLQEILVALGRTKTLTHGHSRRGKITKAYRTWCNMLKRCYDKNCPDYRDYGGRGIEVRIPSFEIFYAHMGDPPPGKSIDRWPDKNGHYEIGNMRWATPKQQVDNRRPRKDGISAEQAHAIRIDPRRPYRIIAEEYGISVPTVCQIIKEQIWRDA